MSVDHTVVAFYSSNALKAVMADPQVMAHLQTLELDVHEGTALFHLLDNGDGEALRSR